MTTPYRPTIHSQADLEEVWRHVLQPLGFRTASLWILLVDAEDRPTPLLTEIADVPRVLDDVTADQLATLLQHLADLGPGGRWALLRSRPGSGGPDVTDLEWAAALYDLCRRHGIRHDVVHLATDDAVRPVPLDEVSGYLRAS